jgi:hypothetical protein
VALDHSFLQNTAEQLGIQNDPGVDQYGPWLPGTEPLYAGQKLDAMMKGDIAALGTLVSIANAIEHPSITSVASAIHSAAQAGISFDPSMAVSAAKALGIYDPNIVPSAEIVAQFGGDMVAATEAASNAAAIGQIGNLMAGAGAAIAVIAAAQDPTPANVAQAATYVGGFLIGGEAIPAAAAIASAIGFVENPNPTNGVTTVLWTIAAINAGNLIGWVSAAAATVISVVSSVFGGGKPIVLDLDGNGVKLIGVDASKAFYDLNGDGVAEHDRVPGRGVRAARSSRTPARLGRSVMRPRRAA